MNIAMVVPEYWPFSFGGGPVHYRSFASALKRRGHNVAIYSGLWGEWTGDLHDDVTYFRLSRPPFGVAGADIRAYMPPVAASIMRMKKVTRTLDADIVHCFGYGFVFNDLFASWAPCPVVYTLMGAPNRPYASNAYVRLAFGAYNAVSGRRALRRAKVIHTISAAAMNHPDLWGMRQRAVVVPNGVDLPIAEQMPVNGIGDRPYILSVGRIQESKGFQTIVEALQLLPCYEYVIAGRDVGYLPTLLALARERGVEDRVRVIGYVSDAEKEWLYANAYAVAIPSLYEPFGLVSLEGMIRCKVVVAAATEGLAETITDGRDGLLHKPNDYRDFVKVFERVHEQRHAIASSAQRRALNQTWDAIAAKFDAVYDAALS